MRKIENSEKFTNFLVAFTGEPVSQDGATDGMQSMTYEDYEKADETTQRIINLAYLNNVMWGKQSFTKEKNSLTLQNFFNDESRQNL